MSYNRYFSGINFLKSDRLFTVLEDGLKVEHHAMKQKESFVFNIGKKFKNIDIYTRYIYSKGKELPENKDNVSSDFILLGFNYKF